MAKEKWFVAFDVQNASPGYDSLAVVKKGSSGTTLVAQEPKAGLRGQVFNARVCEVEAETAAEAVTVATIAYGAGPGGGTGALKQGFSTGVGAAWKASGGEYVSG